MNGMARFNGRSWFDTAAEPVLGLTKGGRLATNGTSALAVFGGGAVA
jgi:hypothetical protein